MKSRTLFRFKLVSRAFSPALLIFVAAAFSINGFAQQNQLSLADLLIGLRSKKATLPEKNKLLTDAAKVRGITFALTPEIEKELAGTGADKDLIETIRQKSPAVKTVDPAPVKMTIAPVQNAPDSTSFQKSAKAHIVKGEFDLAIADYSKSIELDPKDSPAYLNRGLAYHNQKKYELAVTDYNKAIELSPKDSGAYFDRGDSYEKMGQPQKAIADYQKAIEFDATNEPAKTYLQRLQDEQAKIEQAKAEQAKIEQAKAEQAKIEQAKVLSKASAPDQPKTPPIVNLGQLNSVAVRLVTPIYPAIAQKSNIQGLVVVQISLDEEGKVISAKASAGPSMLRAAAENAARQSRFKPALINNQAVQAAGFVSYNFKM